MKKENENLVDWVKSRYKDHIDKASMRHPFMTLIRTRADEKIQKLIQENFTDIISTNKDQKISFDEKNFSIFNTENKEPNFIDKFILFPLHKIKTKLKILNTEYKIYERLKNNIKNLRSATNSIYLVGYFNEIFEKKYQQYEILQEKKKQLKFKLKAQKEKKAKEFLKISKEKDKKTIGIGIIKINSEKNISEITNPPEKKIGLIINKNELKTNLNNLTCEKVENKIFSPEKLIISDIKEDESRKVIGIGALEVHKISTIYNTDKLIPETENKILNIPQENISEENLKKVENKVEIIYDSEMDKTSDISTTPASIINKDLINIKENKINFNTWFYFKVICLETKNKLKFFQGLKSKDIFVDKKNLEILENEKINSKIYNKLKLKRFTNFWRIAFNIKPDFIIDSNTFNSGIKIKKIKPTKNLTTYKIPDAHKKFSIFYKIFFLLKPLNLNYRSIPAITGISIFCLFANFRYSIYKNKKQIFDQQNKCINNYLLSKYNLEKNIFGNKINFSEKKYELKSEMFSKEKDENYTKLILIEKLLLKFAFEINEIKEDRYIPLNEDSEYLEYFVSQFKDLNLDNFNKQFMKKYSDLILMTNFQEYVNSLFKNSVVLFYSLYNLLFLGLYKKNITYSKAVGKSLILFIVLSEISKYFNFFIFSQKFNFASENLLKDHKENFNYYFFRENLLNNLVEIKENKI